MQTQFFDDGSSLSYSPDSGYSATSATDSGSGSGFSFPSGNQVLDALSNGFGRWVDYQTAQKQPITNVPQLPRTPAPQPTGFTLSNGMLALGALVVAGLILGR